jgi:membrane dipeptidase
MRIAWSDIASRSADGLDGRDVVVDGFACPVEPGARVFALLAEAPCCAGCLPRDPLKRIEVHARPLSQAGWVRLHGTWRVLRDDPAGWRYQLLDARPSGMTRRGIVVGGPLLCVGVSLPANQSAVAQARETAVDAVTVDMHSHAGSITGVRRIRDNAPYTPLADPMRQGGMAVVCLAIVSDAPTHRVMSDHRIHPFRAPEPGELYMYGQRSFERLHELVRQEELRVITAAAALRDARSASPSVIVAAEGGDFLEGNVDRVDEAYTTWQLRHLQLTHYRVNELGDIQTEDPVHGGLTDTGADVIRRCNKLGIVVDVAHGTFDLVKRAASVTSKPLILSHTSLAPNGVPKLHSRLISPEHARVVADTGGAVGVWPPMTQFPDKQAMAVGVARMVDVVGIDHVGLGSDMMGLVGPSVFDSYAELPELVAALVAQGFRPNEIRKLLGDNYVRVFAATLA